MKRRELLGLIFALALPAEAKCIKRKQVPVRHETKKKVSKPKITAYPSGQKQGDIKGG